MFFYKRAQILAADVWAAYGRRAPPAPGAPPHAADAAAFGDIGRLTMFADYRVPQLLRAWPGAAGAAGAAVAPGAGAGGGCVLEYAPDLARRVDGGELLTAGCAEEVEIRAATVQAVELLRDAVDAARRRRCGDGSGGSGRGVLVVELDWWLWQVGEKLRGSLAPHHRTLTSYY